MGDRGLRVARVRPFWCRSAALRRGEATRARGTPGDEKARRLPLLRAPRSACRAAELARELRQCGSLAQVPLGCVVTGYPSEYAVVELPGSVRRDVEHL